MAALDISVVCLFRRGQTVCSLDMVIGNMALFRSKGVISFVVVQDSSCIVNYLRIVSAKSKSHVCVLSSRISALSAKYTG